MNIFEKLDDVLMGKGFQPFSDWFHNETGLTNFWLARLALRIDVGFHMLFCVGLGYLFLKLNVYWLPPICILFGLAMNMMTARRLQSIRIIENFHKNNPLVKNPLRLYQIGGLNRTMSLFIVGVGICLLLPKQHFPLEFMTVSMIGNGLYFHFVCCDLKPRRPKEVKERVPFGALPQGA